MKWNGTRYHGTGPNKSDTEGHNGEVRQGHHTIAGKDEGQQDGHRNHDEWVVMTSGLPTTTAASRPMERARPPNFSLVNF